MIRGLYYKERQDPQRLLSIDEVAGICRISPQRVHYLLEHKKLHGARQNSSQVTLTELLRFLLSHNMAVPDAVLPPHSGRILFIAASDEELILREEIFAVVCRNFAEHRRLVLAESAVSGRQANLTIMTFHPEVVVIFQRTCNRSLITTLELISSLPELRSLLFADRATALAWESGELELAVSSVICDDLSNGQLEKRLNRFFRQ